MIHKTDDTRSPDAVSIHTKEPMKNPSRERMKAELVFLRGEVTRLEEELERMLKKRRNHPGNAGPLKRSEASIDALETRRAVERENRQLREALWRQLQVGRQLTSALSGHGGEEFMDQLYGGDVSSDSGMSMDASQLHDETGFRFAQLTEEIDRAYSEIETIFRHDAPVSQQPLTLFNSRMIDGREQIVMEVRDSMAIPFSLERCTYALWYAVNNAPWTGYSRADSYASGPETTCVRLESTQYIRGRPMKMSSTFVLRRFVEKYRTVIVWRCVTSLDGQDDLADVYMDETGWTLLQPVTNDSGEEESVVKKEVVQWIPRSIGVNGPGAIVTHPHTGSFTNLVLTVTSADSSSITNMMENLLIQDCMVPQAGLPTVISA